MEISLKPLSRFRGPPLSSALNVRGDAPEFDPFDRSFRLNPYPTYRRLCVEAPVHRSRFGAWIVASYEGVAFVLSDSRFRAAASQFTAHPESIGKHSRQARLMAHVMTQLDPPEHTSVRRMATGYFVPLNIHGLRPKIQEIADGLLIELSSRAHFDIVADYADPLSMAVIREVFGLPASRESDIRNWANSFFQLFDILPERELQREFDATLGEYTEFLLDLFSERRRAPGNDVVSMMVAAQRGEERLSDWDLLGATTLMLASGFEGPKTLIGNSFYALFAFPEQRSVLQEDPTSIGAAVDEFSRFEAPAQMATRTARENVEIEGTVIRAGEPIIALLGSANRDPERFDNPDTIDFGRPKVRNFAFGAGLHHCLGAALTKLETEIAVLSLLRERPDVEAATPSFLWKSSLINRGLRTLPVTAAVGEAPLQVARGSMRSE